MIQVDMFEVQLGAALLLQFQAEKGRTVRVLADAGEALIYPTGNVHDKLLQAMDTFGDQQRRLDLLIGTHYDADHLDGLVPIIKDTSVEITQAWLPPVANDNEQHAADQPLSDQHFLAKQFHREEGRQVLADYLNAKRAVCVRLRPRSPRDEDIEEPYRSEPSAVGIFAHYRDKALRSLYTEPNDYSHANDEQCTPPTLGELLQAGGLDHNRPWWPYTWFSREPDDEMIEHATMLPTTPSAVHNFAAIRKSAACDAINAISLYKVVEALRSRGVPIACQTVQEGTPRRFVWRSGSERFEAGSSLPTEGPELLLLGPSNSLVKKHWNRLPIGAYAEFARLSLLAVKNITPSNQLSYVLRFQAQDQGILVTGDAGFVDFKPKGTTGYYKDILRCLLPLHVVQVAHHAGNNAHFYHVLVAAKYDHQRAGSFLLLSHATDDKHRPSREFGEFIEELRKEPETVGLLFTTQPTRDKVRDYRSLVCPPTGKAAKQGDVRLTFSNGNWTVVKHVIRA